MLTRLKRVEKIYFAGLLLKPIFPKKRRVNSSLFHEKELKKLSNELINKKNKNIKEMAKLKNLYDNKTTELDRVIKNLNEELSSLKKLTKQQKEELRRMEEQTQF